MADLWEVHIKGSADKRSFEICVIRSSNEHGKLSYGWFGPDKLLISSSGGPCQDSVAQMVWDKLIFVAHEVASELNARQLASKEE